MEFRRYRDEDRERVLEMLSVNKASEYSAGKQSIWDWQFNERSAASSAIAGIVAVSDGGIMGFNGFMPARLIYKGHMVDALWSCDTIVDTRSRGMGIGGEMINYKIRLTELMLGLGISDSQAPMCIKRGYKANEDIQQYFSTNRISSIKELAKYTIQRISSYGKRRNRPARVANCRTEIVSASALPSEITQLWLKHQSEYTKAVVRDHDYISWKYGKHPIADYQLIILKINEEISAIGIFRKHRKVSRFLDYIGPARAPAIKARLIEAFKGACADSETLECTTTDSEFKTVLESFYFKPYKSRPRFYMYSSIAGETDTEKDWFIMGGDSDNDLGEFRDFSNA